MSVYTDTQRDLSERRAVSAAAMLPILLFPAALIALYYGLHAVQNLPQFRQYLALPWLSFWVALHAAIALSVAAMALAGCLGTKTVIEEVSFGNGPRLFIVRIAGVPVSFNPLFPTGYVRFPEPGSQTSTVPARWQRAVAVLAGPAALLAPYVAFTGMRAFPGILAFWQDLWLGGVDSDYGLKLLSHLDALVHGSPATPLLVIIFFGAAAINLLPLPPLSGQVYTLFMPQRWAEKAFQVGMVIYLIAFLAWLRIVVIALGRFVMAP